MGGRSRKATDGYIAQSAYLGVPPIAAAVAAIIGAVLTIIGLFVEWVPCSGFGSALLGLGLVCFGIAIALGLPGSFVFPAILCGAGAVVVLYGLSFASASGCLPTGI